MPHHRPHHLLATTAALTAPLLFPPTAPAINATWLSPTSGLFSDPTRWSTNPNFPNSSSYTSYISPTGSPYTVTATGTIFTGQVNLTSPDATLDLTGTTFSAKSGLNISPGATARLRAGQLYGTTVQGTLLLDPLTPNAPLDLQYLNLTSADLQAAPTALPFSLTFSSALTLNNATVHLSNALLPQFTGSQSFSLSGTGTFLAENDPNSAIFLYFQGTNQSATIAPGITFRTTPNHGDLSLNGLPSSGFLRLSSAGTFSAESPGHVLELYSTLNLTNTGTLAASNGGTLSAYIAPGTSAGTLALGPGGTITLNTTSSYTLNQPVTVPPTARLELSGPWTNTSTLTLDGGTLTLRSVPASPGTIAYVNSPTVELNAPFTPTSLASLHTTPSTNVAFKTGSSLDLASSTFNFSTTPGLFTFNGNTIQNGTLSAGPGGGPRILTSPADSVTLNNLTVNFPLTIDQGTVRTSSTLATRFNQHVTLSDAGRLVLSSFTNTGGISASNGGTLELASLPASPSNISLSPSSTLQLDYNTTLPQFTSLPYGTPGAVVLGLSATLDLQSAPLDLASLPFSLSLAGSANVARITNGSLTDSSHTHPLHVLPAGTLSTSGLTGIAAHDLDISIDQGATLALSPTTTLTNVHLTGQGALNPSGGTLSNVTLDAPARVTSSNATATGSLTLNSTLTLSGAGRLSLSGPVALSGAGTLTFTGIRNAGGTISADSPLTLPPSLTLRAPYVNATLSAPSVTLQGPLLIQPDPTLNPSPTLPTLTITTPTLRLESPLSFSAGTLVLSTTTTTLTAPLTLSNTATLDLKSSTLLLTATDTPPATLRQYLHDTRLTSSASPLGYLLDPANNTTTVKPTIKGDANLDGRLDGDDYALLDRSFAAHTPNAFWWQGDFNYDGTVDASDYLLIDTTYLSTHPASPDFLTQRESQFGATYVQSLLTSVPEPTTLLAACGLALPLLSRRRHPH